MRTVSGDEEIKVGYNTFYWMLYNSKKYSIGYNCEYVHLPKGQFWVFQQCRINKVLSAPNLTCADCRKNPSWTVLPPGEYILKKKSRIPSHYTVYISKMDSSNLYFEEFDGTSLSADTFTFVALVLTGTIPAIDPLYFCNLYIDVSQIKPVKIYYNDNNFKTDTPFYARIDGHLMWIPSEKWIGGYNVVSDGPVFKVHYDPRYPSAVRTDKWTCGEITLLSLPKPKKEVYDLNYYDGYLYFKSNYSGQAELVVGKSVRKIQVKKGINKVPLTVDKETVVCVNPV